MDSHRKPEHASHNMSAGHYKRLAAMTVLSFMAMYILMYAMVDSLDNVYNSINQVYIAGLMAAPMVLIELWLMRSMYQDKRLNLIAAGAALVLGAACFAGIMQQTAI